MTASAAPSTPTRHRAGRAIVRALAAACAVGAASLWLWEGSVKVRAGFGAADILLVADGAGSNSRIPDWFAPLGSAMRAFPTVFGVGIPALELLLGAAFLLVAWFAVAAIRRPAGHRIGTGVRFTAATALASVGTLGLYWTTDQLTGQYPVLLVLSVAALALIAFPARIE